MRCLIIDDEPIARQIVKTYCDYFKNIEVVAECENALQAMDYLRKEKIDVLFLDINMPVITGIDFLKTLTKPPAIIITTAYQQYALDGYELNITDYLLKPFSLERFIKAVNKVNTLTPTLTVIEKTTSNTIFIKADSKVYRFETDNILYCEAQGNYTKIVTKGEVVEAYISLSKIEEQLTDACFVRCHRSFIINTKFVTTLENHRLHLGKYEIPIGSNYRENLFNVIGWKGK
ncbi:MAG: response regulator transcription factor [Saprospirales bacterium]|jgi:DNA-binding LytR/AlgR family response regulator|nr:response regulator transcription factor [Saprospirales bacterium]